MSLLTGCGGGGTPPVSTGSVSFNVSSLTFASSSVGVSSPTQTLTLTNGNSSAITISSVVVSGNNASDFSETSTCAGSLAAGGTCTVTVTFTPTAVGTRVGSVAVVDSASNSPQIATLSGTSTAGLADFNPSPASLTFPATVVGTSSSTMSLTFANTGSGSDTVSSVAISPATDFTQTNTCTAAALAPTTGSCTITVTFTPSVTGALAATLTVTDNSNGIAGTTHTAALSGTGTANALPTVSVSPSSLTFSATAPQAVTVTNTGAVAVSVSGISITGTNASVFSQSNDCGTSIAVGTSCTVSVSFAPGSNSGTLGATLNIADNVSGSPQTVTLSGTAAPVATLAPTALTFTESTLSTTTAAQTVTLTNSGTATMTGIAVSLTGTGATQFGQTNTCNATLAAGATCTISITFTPTASGKTTAALSVADNASGSPQTVVLTGNGPGSAVVTTTLVTVPDDTYTVANPNTFPQLNNFVNSATSTIDMTIYELSDATLVSDLVAQCKAGVTVRALLDNSEKSVNTSAYNTINAQSGCKAVFSNTHFTNTHEKSVVIDAAIPSKAYAVISTGNFDSNNSYYLTGRDFQLYENNATDVAAIEATFQEDWTYPNGTTYPAYTPGNGADLVWSPTKDGANARTAMTAVITNATKSLVIDEEEMSDSGVISALEAAAQKPGMSVKLTTIVGEPSTATVTALKAAGVQITEYPASGNYLYIHAKAIVADYGTSSETAFLGSENCSSNSLTNNRELGIILTDATSSTAASIISTLNTKLTNDFNCTSMAINQTTPNCTKP